MNIALCTTTLELKENPENKVLENKSKLNVSIKKIACDNLKVLAAALALTALTIPFLASPAALGILLLTNIGIVALSVLFQVVTRDELQQLPPLLDRLCRLIPATFFSIVDLITRDVVVHEAGHAFMATRVYKDARPLIEVYPLSGGQTSYYTQKFTSWGKSLGARKCRILVVAAGPAAAVLWNCGSLIAAHKLDKSQPEVSRYLRASAVTSTAGLAYYALSGLWASSRDLAHDFVSLWRGGIHPLASLSTIIALPLIVQTGLILSNKTSLCTSFGYK